MLRIQYAICIPNVTETLQYYTEGICKPVYLLLRDVSFYKVCYEAQYILLIEKNKPINILNYVQWQSA